MKFMLSMDFHGSDWIVSLFEGRIRSGWLGPARPDPWYFESFLTRSDPTRIISKASLFYPRRPASFFENLLLWPVGRIMTRKKPW